jgi:hypothetical protein
MDRCKRMAGNKAMSDTERHLLGVVVKPEDWQAVVTKGVTTRIKCTDGLPLGAKPKYSYIEVKQDFVVLVYEHESFPAVKLGATIPLFVPKFEAAR